MEKSCRKSVLKSSPRLVILVNNPEQPLHARNYFKKRYFKRGLLKTLKKINFIFSFNPVPFNGQSYQKQKGPGTNDQSLFRLRNKFRKISLLVICYLTKFDGVTTLFLSYPKNCTCKFMQANA